MGFTEVVSKVCVIWRMPSPFILRMTLPLAPGISFPLHLVREQQVFLCAPASDLC